MADGRLKLTVQLAPVRDDDDRVEDAFVRPVVKGRELVGEPGYGVALPRAGGVLDEIALARAPGAGVGHESANAVQLLVAGKEDEALARLAAAIVLLLDLLDELPKELEDRVASPGLLPEIRGRIAAAGGRDRRIAGSAKAAFIEGKKASLLALELGSHVDEVRIDREMGEAAAVGEEVLAGIAVALILGDRVLYALARHRIFELRSEDGQTVYKNREIEALLALLTVSELADYRENVRAMEPSELLVEAARRPEVGEPEGNARFLEARAEDGEGAVSTYLGGKALEELGLRRIAVLGLIPSPFLGLGGEDEIVGIPRDEAELPVVILRLSLLIAARGRLAEGRLPFSALFLGVGISVGPAQQEDPLDAFLEAFF